MNPAVDVWWVATSVAPPDTALLPLLDAAERARFESYREPRAARMFLVGAALVRCLAARDVGSSPRSVVVDRTCLTCGKPHGRPTFADGEGLQVSVSHSGGLVGVAVARHDVGLDVEALDRRVDLLPPAAEFLSPVELAAVASSGLGEDPGHLLLWWTRKESVLKLLGTGLRRPPASLSLDLDGDVATADSDSQTLGLRLLACRPGFVASLATPSPVSTAEHDATSLLDDALRGRRGRAHGAASA